MVVINSIDVLLNCEMCMGFSRGFMLELLHKCQSIITLTQFRQPRDVGGVAMKLQTQPFIPVQIKQLLFLSPDKSRLSCIMLI